VRAVGSCAELVQALVILARRGVKAVIRSSSGVFQMDQLRMFSCRT
jgi:hypothetical protein